VRTHEHSLCHCECAARNGASTINVSPNKRLPALHRITPVCKLRERYRIRASKIPHVRLPGMNGTYASMAGPLRVECCQHFGRLPRSWHGTAAESFSEKIRRSRWTSPARSSPLGPRWSCKEFNEGDLELAEQGLADWLGRVGTRQQEHYARWMAARAAPTCPKRDCRFDRRRSVRLH
jgi:hypothetical protein